MSKDLLCAAALLILWSCSGGPEPSSEVSTGEHEPALECAAGEEGSSTGNTLPSGEPSFGERPHQPEAAIRSWFASYLRDPESVQFLLGEAERGYFGRCSTRDAEESYTFAWLVPVQVVEVVEDGAPARTYHCWFHGDKLLAVIDPARLDPRIGVSAALDQ